MTAFATANDLEVRWRPLADAERDRAEVLLADASILLRTWFPDLDARIIAGDIDGGVPVMVVCAMVKRAMLADDRDGKASQQLQQGMGPFTTMDQVTWANPEGNLYVTSQERDLLTGSGRSAVSMTSTGL